MSEFLRAVVSPKNLPAKSQGLVNVGDTLILNVSEASVALLHVKNTGTAAMAAGAFAFEGSLDSTNGIDGTWFTVTTVRTNSPNVIETQSGTLTLAAGAGQVYAWRVSANGLPWLRIRCATAVTASSIAMWRIIQTAQESEPTPAVSGTVSVSNTPQVVLNAAALQANLTTTNLGASATYTGATVDMGSTVTSWSTRVRPTVRHLAGNTPGVLILEESPDNFTTTIESRRIPIPSDGQYHTFDLPLHQRYWRLKFVNGGTAQTGFRLDYITVRGDGSSVDVKNVLNFLLTTTALAANATFTSPTIDLGPNHDWNLVRYFANPGLVASATSGVRIDWSDDGTNWLWDEQNAVSATDRKSLEAKVQARYVRFVWANGTNAQTIFRAMATLISL